MDKVLSRVQDGYTYAGDLDLKIMTCPACGVTYAMPLTMQQNAYEKGERKIVWFCPNGHELGYNGPSEDEKARRKAESDAQWYRDRHAATKDLLEHTEHRLRAQKGATTRARKRHASGMCPCCSRSFVQLRRHMASQHPDYLAEHGIAPNVEDAEAPDA